MKKHNKKEYLHNLQVQPILCKEALWELHTKTFLGAGDSYPSKTDLSTPKSNAEFFNYNGIQLHDTMEFYSTNKIYKHHAAQFHNQILFANFYPFSGSLIA